MLAETLLSAGRLLQQFMVDVWASIQQERTVFCRDNQKKLRGELYFGLKDALIRGDTDGDSIGCLIVLPSKFTGGPRYMAENY